MILRKNDNSLKCHYCNKVLLSRRCPDAKTIISNSSEAGPRVQAYRRTFCNNNQGLTDNVKKSEEDISRLISDFSGAYRHKE
jgi:hypothetical protein